MTTDPIADMLNRIKNAQTARHPVAFVPASTKKERVLQVLLSEGYIAAYHPADDADGKPQFKVVLKYDNHGLPAIRELKRVSTPGRRVYVGSEDIPKNRSGLGVVIVSTSQGVMSDTEARTKGIGGEIICSVF